MFCQMKSATLVQLANPRKVRCLSFWSGVCCFQCFIGQLINIVSGLLFHKLFSGSFHNCTGKVRQELLNELINAKKKNSVFDKRFSAKKFHMNLISNVT